MNVTKDNRNATAIIIFGLLLLLIVYVIYALVAGTSQDQVFVQNNNTFTQMSTEINQGNYMSAKLKARDLLQKYPDNYMVNWCFAITLYGTGDYDSATQYYEAARRLRPFLVTDPQFLTQYGQCLYRVGNYEKALKYFEQLQQISPQKAETIKPFIDDIKNRLKLK